MSYAIEVTKITEDTRITYSSEKKFRSISFEHKEEIHQCWLILRVESFNTM